MPGASSDESSHESANCHNRLHRTFFMKTETLRYIIASDALVDVSCVIDQFAAGDGSSSQPVLSLSLSDEITDDDVQTTFKSETLSVIDSCSAEGKTGLAAAVERNMADASSDDSTIDQWNRSIVVSDVPAEISDNMLGMELEMKKRGGGRIDFSTRDTENRKVLVTFTDAAGRSVIIMLLNTSCAACSAAATICPHPTT